MLTHLIVKTLGQLGYTVKRRRPGILRENTGQLSPVESGELMSAIHGHDIYAGFAFEKFPFDAHGWGGDSKAFDELIATRKPKLVIEVGSWKGASALTIAASLKRHGGGKLLCIDTWLGALEFWSDQTDPERFKALECHHGYPQVYYRFLANVCHKGFQETITPFPIHSSSGALWLMRNSVQAEMIYVDASHEEEDVYQDILDYYQLVAPGGVLFGDDWSWSGVRAAVERYAKEEKITIRHLHDKWLLEK